MLLVLELQDCPCARRDFGQGRGTRNGGIPPGFGKGYAPLVSFTRSLSPFYGRATRGLSCMRHEQRELERFRLKK